MLLMIPGPEHGLHIEPLTIMFGVAVALMGIISWFGELARDGLLGYLLYKHFQQPSSTDVEKERQFLDRYFKTKDKLNSSNPSPIRTAAASKSQSNEPDIRIISDDNTPDIASSADTSLLNLNSATAAQLATLPGVTALLAEVAIQAREEQNGFQSVQEFTTLLGLNTFDIQKIHEMACVCPYGKEQSNNHPRHTQLAPQEKPSYRMIDT